jgi:hypothetical protein
VAAVEGVSEPLRGPLAEALERRRAEYNARARATGVTDVESLAEAVRGLDGVVRSAHACDPAGVDAVVSALFDATLGLVRWGLLGPRSRRPRIGATWLALLEAAPGMVCADPARVVAATANACASLAEVRGARLADWAGQMAAMASRAAGVDAWLRAGVVAAWRSGLAHTRAGALEVAANLPPDLAALAVGLDVVTPAEVVARVLDRLRADPWLWPPDVAGGTEQPPAIKFVCRIGGFRGFVPDGRFLAPPTIGLRDGVFVACDGERTFELHADFFGATLVPVGPASRPAAVQGALILGEGGEVRCGDLSRAFPGFAKNTTWASTDTTLVAASACSHHLSVIARSGYGL